MGALVWFRAGRGLTLPRASFSCFSDAACFMLASRTILWASWEEGRLCVSTEGRVGTQQTHPPPFPRQTGHHTSNRLAVSSSNSRSSCSRTLDSRSHSSSFSFSSWGVQGGWL